MRPQIATSREQSERLMKCGIDPKTADMVWTTFENDGEKYTKLDVMDEYAYEFASLHPIPAWSLSALLAFLPTSLRSSYGTEYMLELSKLRMHDAWEVQWWHSGGRWKTIDKDNQFHKLWDKSPIEACVKAIEWLTQNGYKLNEQ